MTFLIRALPFAIFVSCFIVSPPNGVAGESERRAWTTSRMVGSPEAAAPLKVAEIYQGALRSRVVDVQFVPDSPNLLALHLDGEWRMMSGRAEAPEYSLVFDFRRRYSDHFQSLGFTFDPNFLNNRFVYVCYSRKPNPGTNSRIIRVARFRLEGKDSLKISPESELELIRWEASGHNGGCLKFGPSGYLYVSVGDGRPPSPPDALRTGQDVSDLRASILRLDVADSKVGDPYRIPRDNPFVAFKGARPEVWAFGFRNPWRMSFHPETGDLWLGDVGWEKWEMIHRVQRGGNYGWSVFEGSQQVIHPNDEIGPSPITKPAYEYPHTTGRSVTGGFFYHGEEMPQLVGSYIFGDFESGRVYALWQESGLVSKVEEIARTGLQIISFTEAPNGEIWVVGYDGGLFRFVPNPSIDESTAFPRTLSETGIFSSVATLEPSDGVYRYDVRTPLFEPGVEVSRVIGVPEREKIAVFERNMLTKGMIKGEWQFPLGTVFARTVSVKNQAGALNRHLETQVLLYDGIQFQPYNYIWREDQSDADLAGEGMVETVIGELQEDESHGEIRWQHMGRADCQTCHLIRTGGVQGFVDWQLDRSHDESSPESLLERFRSMGFFAAPQTGVRTIGAAEKAAIPEDSYAKVKRYLHVNCAHCHRPQGGGGAQMDLRYETPLKGMGLVGHKPLLGEFGLDEPFLIAPGKPERSVLFYRLAKFGAGHMPRLGSPEIDYGSLGLIADWIESLSGVELGPAAAIGEQQERVGSVSSALGLVREIVRGKQTLASWQPSIDAALASPDPLVSELFEGFVLPSDRVDRVGDTVSFAQLEKLGGRRLRGEQIFLGKTGVQCVSCHAIDGTGGDFGPSLDGLARRFKGPEILDALVKPSQHVSDHFAAYSIELNNGDALFGQIRSQSLSTIRLKTSVEENLVLPRSQIYSLSRSAVSLMPEGLLLGMPMQDAADLLQFLMSLE